MYSKRKFAVGFGGIILLVYFIQYVSLIQLIQLVLLGTVLIGIYVCTPWITETSQMVLLEITQLLEKAAQMDTTIKVQIGSAITGLSLLYMTELPFAQWFILVLFETAAFTVCYSCRTDADTNIKSLVDNIFKMEVMRSVAVGIGIASLTVFCTANLTCNQRITLVLIAVVYDRICCFFARNRYFNKMIEMVMDYTLMLDIVAKVSVGMVFVSLSFYLDDVLVSQWNMWNLLIMLGLALSGVCCRFAFDGDVKEMTGVVVNKFTKLDTSMKASVVMGMASTFLFYIQYLSFIQWLSTLLIEISFVHIFFKVVSTGNTLEDMLVIAVENIEKMNRTRKLSLAIHVCSLSILCTMHVCTMHVSVIQMTTMVLVSVSLVRISYFISWNGKLQTIIKREINNLSSMDNKTKASVGVGFISLIILYLIEFSYTLLISTLMAVYILRRTVSNINGDEWSLFNWITSNVTKDDEKEEIEDINLYVKRLGISHLYPDKISLTDVTQVQSQSKSVELKDIVLMFVKNILMLNFHCRDQLVMEYLERVKDGTIGNLNADLGRINETLATEINPIDLTVATFKCSSPTVKQILASKLCMCKLAIPLVFPDKCTWTVWPLRAINLRGINGYYHTAVNCPCHILSFCRLGKPSLSKSKLLNAILFDNNYNTFFNQDCPLGNTKRRASAGLVEAAWYVPSGQSNIFENITMFLNLRGDGKSREERLQVLAQMSAVSVIMTEMSNLNHSLQNLLEKTTNGTKLLFAIDAKNYSKQNVEKMVQTYLHRFRINNRQFKCVLLSVDGKSRSLPEVRNDMRRELCNLLTGVKINSIADRLKQCNVQMDEDDEVYKAAKDKAKEIFKKIPDKVAEIKEQVVPLQDKPWNTWSSLLKKASRKSECKSVQDDDKLRIQMHQQRYKQNEMCKTIGEPMQLLINTLSYRDNYLMFVQFLKFFLDERSRITLLESEHNLAEASFGFEHLCREIGQMFEAMRFSPTQDESLKLLLKQLPEIGAKLLLAGEPLEIVHGESENIPVTWIEAVFHQLKERIGDKQLLTLSVVGFKGSGKTTLLKSIFGLQFPNFSGRYSGGAFIHLVPVVEKTKPFDYVLVIDPEGFQSLKVNQDEQDYDNSLATFVIGLADIVIVNLKDEDSYQREIVLNIVVSAFLSVKLAHKQVNLKQSCVFVNQNVPSPETNNTKNRKRQELVDTLDSITKKATDKQNVTNIASFNKIIDFERENNIVFLPAMWTEESQMATVNPDYCNTVAELAEFILFDLTSKRDTCLTIGHIAHRIKDLWTGILKGDFLSSFRNTLEEEAYISMEKICEMFRWKIVKFGNEFVRTEAKSMLMNIQKEEEMTEKSILDRSKNKINRLVEEHCKELYSFVQQSSLRDNMMNWIKGKQDSMRVQSNKIIGQIEKDIKKLIEEMRLQRTKLMEKIKQEEEINELARQLAISMRGKTPTIDTVKEEFDKGWNSWSQTFTEIEYYKRTAWMLFQILVQIKTEDVIDKCSIQIAVGFFREAIIRTVVEHVNELLPFDVEGKIRRSNVYLHSKLGLMKEIMLHLAKTENFEDYMEYIIKPKEFAKSYVMKLTSTELFEGNEKDTNRFQQLASIRIRDIFVKLSTILSETMSRDSLIDNIEVWVDNFMLHVSEANFLPISNDKLIHLRKREEFDMIIFRRMVNEELVDIEKETLGHFKQQDDTTVKRTEETVSNLIEKLWGCPEICMFCKEPCQHMDKDHKEGNILHQCIEHRPQGMGGMHIKKNEKKENLVVDCCNSSVKSTRRYRRPNDNEYLPYKDYKLDYPDWVIHPSSDSSKYWMWVMCKYKEEFTDFHKVQPPIIPEDWRTITKEQAIESIM